MYQICTELETLKKNYDTSIKIVDGLPFRQKDVIRMIEHYSNSKYLNGQKDELGRDKPFYNIVNAMCDVENAAKDIDTKDIGVTSDDGQHYTESFLMSKDIYEWMKAVNFAKTLNDMRDAHTRYGSLLVKKVEKEEEDGSIRVNVEIPEWKNTITDQIDIKGGGIAEVHYMTPKQLLDMEEWDQAEIKKIVKKNAENGSSHRIPVYEVRGDFPLSCIKELEGKKVTPSSRYKYTYQLWYLAGEPKAQEEQGGENNGGISSELVPLYWENDTERVYKYLARKKKSGRDFGVGVIEEGEEAQVGTNDAVLKQSRAMAYTTKVIGQTASRKLKGRNMLTEVDDGQILETEDKKPITSLNLLPAGGLGQYGSLIQQWYAQFEKTTSAYAAQRGEAPPSGTPFRLQAAVLQQSGNVFQDLQEELGIFVTEIFEDWIMPHLAKQLNKEHILAHEFTMQELKEIDKNFSRYHANEKAKELILSGQIVTPEEYAEFQQASIETIGQTKAQRFLQVPKDYYKKFKAKITVNVTGEQRNKAAVLESLINIMTVYAKNPAIAQDPVLTQIFMKIVELSGAGISPVSLMGAISEQAKMLEKQQAMAATEAAAAAGAEDTRGGGPAGPGLSLAASGGAQATA